MGATRCGDGDGVRRRGARCEMFSTVAKAPGEVGSVVDSRERGPGRVWRGLVV